MNFVRAQPPVCRGFLHSAKDRKRSKSACVRFSPDSQLIVAGGGVARIQGEMIEFPTEQIRVYKILDAEQQSPAKQPQDEAQ